MFPHKQSPSIHLFNCLSNSQLQRQWSQSQLSQGGGRVPPGQATCLSTIPNLIHTNGQLRITNKPNVHFFLNGGGKPVDLESHNFSKSTNTFSLPKLFHSRVVIPASLREESHFNLSKNLSFKRIYWESLAGCFNHTFDSSDVVFLFSW